MPHSRFPTTELPDPAADPGLLRTYEGYRAALRSMTIEQLMERADRLARQITADQQEQMSALLMGQLSSYSTALDRPSFGSPRTASPPSVPDRGASSQASPAPRLPSAVDLLAASRRMAPRVAAKLVLAEARRARADRDG